MSEDKRFYVYVHKYASGPKEGQVFYVGKGSGSRYKFPHGRSDYWNRIVEKYGYKYKILARFSIEKCAFSFERALISFHGRENLCNLSDGGEGQTGFSHNDTTKEKMSKSHTGKKFTETHKENLSKSLKTLPIETFQSFLGKSHSEETIKKMSSAKIGKIVSRETRKKISETRKSRKYELSDEWRRNRSIIMSKNTGVNSLNYDKNVYTFFNLYGVVENMTRVEFGEKYEISLSLIGKLVNGKCKTAKGWMIKND